MPRRNGTGPTGQGALTGRGFGSCTEKQQQYGGFVGRGFGSFFGRGCGRGMGFFGGGDTINLEEEEKFLKKKIVCYPKGKRRKF